MQQTRRRRRVRLSPWLWVGSRRERGSRDLVPDRRLLPEHASIDEDYWRTDVDVPIVFSERPALFKVISRVEEPRTTCFDNTYLPVLLEAFFNGALMNDQLVDPVSLLIEVYYLNREDATLTWPWVGTSVVGSMLLFWVGISIVESIMLSRVGFLDWSPILTVYLAVSLYLFVQKKTFLGWGSKERRWVMDSALFTDRVWAGRAPLIVLLNVGRSGWVCFVCVRACVSGRGRSCCSRHTQQVHLPTSERRCQLEQTKTLNNLLNKYMPSDEEQWLDCVQFNKTRVCASFFILAS